MSPEIFTFGGFIFLKHLPYVWNSWLYWSQGSLAHSN